MAEGFREGFEENITNANDGAQKRAWGEGGSSDSDKADEENPAEGGARVGVSRKPRGRPLGSRNKPKGPPHGIVEDTMKNHIIEVPGGFEITNIVQSFMRCRDVGVIVLGGRGNVTDVDLREPVAVGGMVDNTAGPFEIVSLTGAFPRGGGVDTQGSTGLRVTLTDAQGNHVGGTVESLVAYGTVQVTVGTVMNINREVLNVQHPGRFLSPPAVVGQHQFQSLSPTMTTLQQSLSPTLMTVQHQIDMVPAMNNAMPNLAIGTVRPASHELMHNVMPNMTIGSVRPNSQDLMNDVMPNLAIGLVRPNYPQI